MKTRLAVLVILLAIAQIGWCQEPAGMGYPGLTLLADDIDALFEEPPAEEEDRNGSDEDVLSSIVGEKSVVFSGDFRATAGYTGGFMQYSGADAWEDWRNAAAYSMSAQFRVDARLDRTMRIFGALKAEYPELDVGVHELFCDYVFLDTLYLRAGRQTITWGASQFFPFTDLPGRLSFDADGDVRGALDVSDNPTGDGIDDGDSIALKVTLPVGLSGVTGLVLARNGYFDEAEKPGFRELGYGGLLDLSVSGGEIVLGGFYQQDLRGRAYLSVKTTLWGVDLYGQSLVSDSLEYAAGGGLIWERWESRLIVMAEYLYNGETTELSTVLSDYPLPQGHTGAFRLGIKDVPFAKSKTGLEWRHNFSDGSGTVIPGFSYDAIPHLRLRLAVPIVYGPDGGYFVTENPDLRDRRLAVLLLATLSGSF